jgi:hypothetical protein
MKRPSMKIDQVIPEEYRCRSWWCRVYSHWLNPFGNWQEPLPYPQARAIEAEKSWMPPMLYWTIRNPFHNFMNHWIGIVPIGPQYSWILPEEAGWTRHGRGNRFRYWTRPWSIPRPYYRVDGKFTFYIGWTDRGNFGMSFRRNIG